MGYQTNNPGTVLATPTGSAAGDSALLQSLIDQAKVDGKPVELGAGTFQISTEVSCTWSSSTTGLTIRGQGPNTTILSNQTGTDACLRLAQSSGSAYAQHWLIEDIGFEGPSSSPALR